MSITTIHVSGMHCPACERRIVDSLSVLDGVDRIRADATRGTVRYRIRNEAEGPTHGRIAEVLSEAGYPKQEAPTGTGFPPVVLGVFLVLMAAAAVLLGRSGLLNRIPVVQTGMALSAVFVVGLLTSVHCVGMCGGLCLAGSLSPGRSRRFAAPGLYNLGRLISYTGVGFLAGALGSVITPSPTVQGIVILAAALLMLLYGLKMTGLITIPFRLPGLNTGKLTGRGPLLIGILNGFIPCGPLQAVQLFALGTGSPWTGAAVMALFCLGTMPLLFSFGALGNLMSVTWQRRVNQLGALVILVMAAGMGVRGWRLSGLPLPGPTAAPAAPAVTLEKPAPPELARAVIGEDGIQRIRTDITPRSYDRFVIQAGVPLEWTIFVEEGDLNGCNNPITFPGTDVMIPLEVGENHISFTPTGTGRIPYMCWMGMITSSIEVVEDLAGVG